MSALPPFDDDLVRRLPLPLAQLYRRAHNAKTPLDRHLTAFFLWEASLKLLASTAIVAYARLGQPEPELTACLEQLARPSLGHWWEFVRRLLPVLAERGRAEFVPLRDLVLGRGRDDLPRAAGLDAALREALDGKTRARARVYPVELFEGLVRYRNKEIGHGAAGQRPAAFYERMGASLLLGVAEVLGRLDVLAGGKLLHVAEVRQVEGNWLVQRYELSGETARRLESVELPRAEAGHLPDAERVYLLSPLSLGGRGAGGEGEMLPLHPLVIYDPEANEAAFLNSRPGKRKTEYLCYTSGKSWQRPDLGSQQRGLLAQVLGIEVSEEEVRQWAERAQADEPAPEAPARRRTLGEFELLSELGRGGMGVVYRAWQPSLGRQVALKALLHTGDPKAEGRFQREIRALGQVEHPNLVKVFTSGSDGDQWFYVMELVEGAPLSAVCDELQTRSASVTAVDVPLWQQALGEAVQKTRQQEKPLSDAPAQPDAPPAGEGQLPALPAGRDYVRHVAELVRQAAEAAHALHEHGVIHRDIKPGNILLSADGTHAVLMDLGLAQLADDVQGRLTRTRQFVGTLRYASPEQVLAVGRLDRRSDVYSLGATLWELLTLRPLFGATEQTPTPELMKQITTEEPERVRKHHPGIPRDLEAIVHKCLEKKEADRYPTARELAEDLRRFQRGEPVAARPVSGWQRTLRWMVRHPTQTAAAGLMLLALVLLVGGGGAVWLWRATEAARREAEAARVRAEAAQALAKDALTKEDEALRGEQQARRETQQALAGETQARQDAQQALAGEKQARREKEELLARIQYLGTFRLAHEGCQEGHLDLAKQFLAQCSPEYRGWEWDYVQRQSRLESRTLRGNFGTILVLCVAFSPDGRRIASGGPDKIVHVWDVATGRETLTLMGHSASVRSVAFSPDGKRLASGSQDKSVRVLDLTTGLWDRTLRGHSDEVTSVAFSPDGSRLASGSGDRTVRLWDLASGKEVLTLRGHSSIVYSIAFSPDGKRLASGSGDKTVRLWDLATGQEALTLKGHSTEVTSVAFSPDGERLGSGSLDNSVRVWDLGTGQEALTLSGHSDWIWSLAFSPDGRQLASGSKDSTVRLWDLATGVEALKLRGHSAAVSSLAFSPDGRRLASGSWDRTVRVWDLAAGQEALMLKGHSGPAWHVAFSPDGRRLAGGSQDRTVRLWDLATGKEALMLTDGSDKVTDVAFSPDGRQLASGSLNNTVRLWDLATGKATLTLTGHSDAVTGVAFSPDGRQLASGSLDGTVRVWDLASGKATRALRGHPDKATGMPWLGDSFSELSGTLLGRSDQVTSVAFSPDGRRLACGLWDSTVRLWDLNTGKQTLTLSGHSDTVSSVAFSPDGRRLASASKDRTVRLWDPATGREALVLKGHSDAVWSVAFSPDGRRLASSSLGDSSVRVWDLATGQEALALEGHTSGVTGVAFSPDGGRLAAASMFTGVVGAGLDSPVLVWELEPERYWQLRQARWAEENQHWSGAVFWLSRLAEEESRFAASEAVSGATCRSPLGAVVSLHGLRSLDVRSDPADLLRRRGNAYAELGDWNKAIADFAAARQFNAFYVTWQAWAQLAWAYQRRTEAAAAASAGRWPLLAVASSGEHIPRDFSEYRRTCKEMMRDFGTTHDAQAADAVARTGVLLREALSREEAEKLAALAKVAVDAEPNNPEYLQDYGAALYRAGRLEEAFEQLNKAVDKSGPGGNIWEGLFLAMVHHRLGRPEHARQWLKDTEDQIAKLNPRGKGSPHPAWTVQLVSQLLLDEARDVLGAP